MVSDAILVITSSWVGVIKESDLKKIAEIKMLDLNANTVSQAVEMIRGTAKSMGIEVKE